MIPPDDTSSPETPPPGGPPPSPSAKTPQQQLEATLKEMKRLLKKLEQKAKSNDEADTAYGEWKPKLDSLEKRKELVVEALSAALDGAAEDEERAHQIKSDSDDSSDEKRSKEAQRNELMDSAKSERKQQQKAADEQFKRINSEAQPELEALKDVPGTD